MSIAPALSTAPLDTSLRLHASGPLAPWDGCGGGVHGGIALAARSHHRLRMVVGEVAARPVVRRELSDLLPRLVLRETLAAAPLSGVAELLDRTVRRSDSSAGFSATLVDLFPDGRVTACLLASPAPAVAHDAGDVVPLMPGADGIVTGTLDPGQMLLVFSAGFLENTVPGALGAAPRQYRLHHSVDAVWAGLMPVAEPPQPVETAGAALAVFRRAVLVPSG
jgi:hypothetical protein